MIVDCGDCSVRGEACSDCVVSVLLGVPGMPSDTGDRPVDIPFGRRRLRLEQDEQAAMAVLADSGLVPRLRLVGRSLPRADASPGETPGVGPEHAAG